MTAISLRIRLGQIDFHFSLWSVIVSIVVSFVEMKEKSVEKQKGKKNCQRSASRTNAIMIVRQRMKTMHDDHPIRVAFLFEIRDGVKC